MFWHNINVEFKARAADTGNERLFIFRDKI